MKGQPGKVFITRTRRHGIRHAAFERSLKGQTQLYAYVPPKIKVRSILSNQKHIETLFNNLDRQKEENKLRTEEYRENVLETIGSEARVTLSRDELAAVRAKSRNTKADLKAGRKERKEEEEKAEGAFLDEYHTLRRRKGQTVDRKQEEVLGRRFPKAEGQMTAEETVDYESWKTEWKPGVKASLEATDAFLKQVCTLQYIPRDPKPDGLYYPNGKVAYFNAKTKKKVRNKMVEILVQPPVTVQWVKFCFKPGYVNLLMEHPREWHRVVIGNHRPDEEIAPENYRTNVPVSFPQGQLDHCLFLCLASALHYMGLEHEATMLASMASMAENLPGTTGLNALIRAMKECAPSIAVPTIFNVSHKKRKRAMERTDLEIFNPYPTVVIPQGADGSIGHAICVIDDLIFDTSQAFALKCTMRSMGWICHCGPKSFEGVLAAYRFERGYNCKTHVRKLLQNYEPTTQTSMASKK